jgi:hypothetical protein
MTDPEDGLPIQYHLLYQRTVLVLSRRQKGSSARPPVPKGV